LLPIVVTRSRFMGARRCAPTVLIHQIGCVTLPSWVGRVLHQENNPLIRCSL